MKNSHNATELGNIIDFDKVSVGDYSYGVLNVEDMSDSGSKLKIGFFCSIAADVKFLLGADHDISYISTFPFKRRVLNMDTKEAVSKGDIIVDDDVWICHGATILSGVHIGQGAVVAAGAVVCKDVEPYAVVGGVPAKQIKKRFSEELIQELLKIDFSKLDAQIIREHGDELYKPFTDQQQLAWLPKKTGRR